MATALEWTGVGGLAAVAAAWDLKQGRVPNGVTVAAAASGILASTIVQGPHALPASLFTVRTEPSSTRYTDAAKEQIMRALLVRLVREEDAQDLIEYALLAALLALVSVAVLTTLGPVIADKFTEIQTKLK